MTPFYTYYIIKSSIYSFEIDDFKNVTIYSPFFQEFHYRKGFNFLWFTPYFFLRRLFYAIILYQLTDFPIIQVSLNMLHTLVIIFYLLKYRPFNEKHDNVTNICQEFLICIVFGLCGFFILEIDELHKKILEIVIISLVYIAIGISYGQTVYFGVKKIVEYIRNRKKNKKFIAVIVSPPKNSQRYDVLFKSRPEVSAVEEFKENSLYCNELDNFHRENKLIIRSESGETKYKL